MFHLISLVSLTTRARVPSPVVPAPGVGQVGLGLQNSWGLEEDDDDSDDEEEKKDEGGVVQEEKVTKMQMGGGGCLFCQLQVKAVHAGLR